MRTIERDKLNDVMEFDHVIEVYASGHVETDVAACWAPQLYATSDADGSHVPGTDADLIDQAKRQGWELLTGITGQYGYSGPCMHASEVVGGGLADRILATPGYWVTVVVWEIDDSEPDCWALAFRRNGESP